MIEVGASTTVITADDIARSLRGRKRIHRGPLQRISAAGPDLHGEGGRDVLIDKLAQRPRDRPDPVAQHRPPFNIPISARKGGSFRLRYGRKKRF
jgi:hypothetical protein